MIRARLGPYLTGTMGLLVIVLLGGVTVYLIPQHPVLALLIPFGLVLLGLSAADSSIIPLLCVPALLVVMRVEVGGTDLSVSDAFLFVATLTALVFAPRPFSPPMANILWLSACYQFATLFTVLVNPYRANAIEWVHTWVLVSGAALVGWAIGRAGRAAWGMSLLLGTSVVLAVVTLVHAALQYAGGDFGPVYVDLPYSMHKNFVGTLLAFAAIVAYARPRWTGWSSRWATGSFLLCTAGVVVTQSRQAVLGLAIGLLVVALRERRLGRRPWRLLLFVVVPGLALVATMVRDQIAAGDSFNSVAQRMSWLSDSLVFWTQSPWVGHGLRYWYRGIPGMDFQPPNAEVEVLTSAGLVGLAGFLIMMVGVMTVIWRVDPRFGTVGAAVLVARLTQAQVDLFWSAVQASVPFLVIGICVGAAAYHHDLHPYRSRGLNGATREVRL